MTVAMVLALLCPSVAVGQKAYDSWWGEIGNGLVSSGAPEGEARAAFQRISTLDLYETGPGSWVYEFGLAARVHHRRAEELEVEGELAAALAEYRAASAYYNAARWPALYTPARKAAYASYLDTYFKIVSYSNLPLEVIRIPFEGKEIVAHLHVPPAASPPPVVVWSGGLDGWKSSGMDFKQTLLDEGFAVLAMDLPGTGQSQWLLEPDSDRIYSRAIDWLKTRPDVDASRVGVYFGSFSGVFAIKLALVDPDVKAAVNHSGGIHLFFHPQRTEIPPLATSVGMRATATAFSMGLAGRPIADILANYSRFSLKNQGLLVATPNQAPLMNIYGTEDILMPIEDLHYLIATGVESDDLVYEGDGHMAWEHADDHRPKMIEWLKAKLAAN